MLRWCALPLPQYSDTPEQFDHTPAADGPHLREIGRLAESKDAVIFARSDEVEKCEFIKANAPEEAWASTDDGAGLLIKASALREQAREILVRSSEPLDRLTDRGRD